MEIDLKIDKRFSGIWYIKEMEVWDGAELDLLGSANITFDNDGYGSFQFLAVVGFIDCNFSNQNGLPFVEFSWQGHDDGEDSSGRGWAVIESNKNLRGHIFFHYGDDSAFAAGRIR